MFFWSCYLLNYIAKVWTVPQLSINSQSIRSIVTSFAQHDGPSRGRHSPPVDNSNLPSTCQTLGAFSVLEDEENRSVFHVSTLVLLSTPLTKNKR